MRPTVLLVALATVCLLPLDVSANKLRRNKAPRGGLADLGGLCGAANGGAQCRPTQCCSAAGYCGRGASWCGTGCQTGEQNIATAR